MIKKRGERKVLQIISLGAGVQSSTMALMAAKGEITPMPDYAIFADTQNEPKAVYEWLDWLEKQLPFPVIRVTAGNLWKDVTKVRTARADGHKYISGGVPTFFKAADGMETTARKGLGQRQCTRNFKIRPINKKVRELCGIKRATKSMPVLAEIWMGISADEGHRAKPSQEPWIRRRHPLILLGADREDCIDWMRINGYPKPPRSACIFCPFHDDESWAALTPEELALAGKFEKELQASYAQLKQIDSVPYLHKKRIPITEVKFEPKPEGPQRLFRLFGSECEGLCGT